MVDQTPLWNKICRKSELEPRIKLKWLGFSYGTFTMYIAKNNCQSSVQTKFAKLKGEQKFLDFLTEHGRLWGQDGCHMICMYTLYDYPQCSWPSTHALLCHIPTVTLIPIRALLYSGIPMMGWNDSVLLSRWSKMTKGTWQPAHGRKLWWKSLRNYLRPRVMKLQLSLGVLPMPRPWWLWKTWLTGLTVRVCTLRKDFHQMEQGELHVLLTVLC